MILCFSLELQRVTHVKPRVTPCITLISSCFLGGSQRVTCVTLHFKKVYIHFLNVVLRVLPVTVHLKTLQTGCYAWCYTSCDACYPLPFLLHAFAWPLNLPNLVLTLKLSKILNVNRTEQKTLHSKTNKMSQTRRVCIY